MGYKALNRIEVMRNKKKVIVPAGEEFNFNEKEVEELKEAGVIEKVKSSSGGKQTSKKSEPKKSETNKVEQKDNGDDLGLGDGQK